MESVRQHELLLLSLLMTKLSSVEGVTLYGPRDLDLRSGVVSFTVDKIHPHDLSTVLDQDGVCIRAGHHCAQPLMRRLNVSATARASVYVYNDATDIEALLRGVERAKQMFG
jgi:cysteine desulfurase/selenocysteine lyase